MKNRVFTVMFLLFFSLCFFGCVNQTEPPTSNEMQRGNDEYLYLTEESIKNLISVQIPVVATANAQAVNTCIKEQVYQELRYWLFWEECNLKEASTPVANIRERIESSEYSTQYLHISGCLSFESEELISLVFTGTQNVKSAAHPNEVFFSINVDIPSAQRIGIADVYSVDDTLYSAFLQHVSSERIPRNELMTLNIFEKDAFLEGLTKESEKGLYSYFTPTHVGISYPVAYALGNHIEAEIPKGFFAPSIKTA